MAFFRQDSPGALLPQGPFQEMQEPASAPSDYLRGDEGGQAVSEHLRHREKPQQPGSIDTEKPCREIGENDRGYHNLHLRIHLQPDDDKHRDGEQREPYLVRNAEAAAGEGDRHVKYGEKMDDAVNLQRFHSTKLATFSARGNSSRKLRCSSSFTDRS